MNNSSSFKTVFIHHKNWKKSGRLFSKKHPPHPDLFITPIWNKMLAFFNPAPRAGYRRIRIQPAAIWPKSLLPGTYVFHQFFLNTSNRLFRRVSDRKLSYWIPRLPNLKNRDEHPPPRACLKRTLQSYSHRSFIWQTVPSSAQDRGRTPAWILGWPLGWPAGRPLCAISNNERPGVSTPATAMNPWTFSKEKTW